MVAFALNPLAKVVALPYFGMIRFRFRFCLFRMAILIALFLLIIRVGSLLVFTVTLSIIFDPIHGNY